MKNHVYFIPIECAANETKRFMFFEHLYDGRVKMSVCENTKQALAVCEQIITGSKLHIVIDSSTEPARNFLTQVLPITEANQAMNRLYLSQFLHEHQIESDR